MNTILSILITLLASVVFAIVATVLGCLLAGLDRKVTARMQGRVGPPLLQPYYDVRKLFCKENTAVTTAINSYVFWALIFTFIAGGVFCGDLRASALVLHFALHLFRHFSACAVAFKPAQLNVVMKKLGNEARLYDFWI